VNPINLNKHLYVGMNSKVWQNEIEFHRKVERVFFEVCELSPEEQRNVLNDLTDGDMKLRSTVAGMLQRDQEVDPFFDNNARIPDSAAFGLLEVGSIVDSWEIVRLLGEGGMVPNMACRIS